MPFSNCVSFNYALHQLDLFDNIEGKYLKYYFQGNLDLDEYDFQVEIEEVKKEDSKRGYVLIVEYELKNPKWVYNKNVLGNSWLNLYNIPEYITFTTELDYDANSPLAWLIGQDLYEETEDEEESDEESDVEYESSEEEEMIITFTKEQVFNQEVIDCDWYELCVRHYEDGELFMEDKIGEYKFNEKGEERLIRHINRKIDFEWLDEGAEIIVFVCEENNCHRERLFEYVWDKKDKLKH